MYIVESNYFRGKMGKINYWAILGVISNIHFQFIHFYND